MLQREHFAEYWPSHQQDAGLLMLVRSGCLMAFGCSIQSNACDFLLVLLAPICEQVSSIMAITYNLVHASMIKNVSAVATTVLGEVKIVALLVLSALLLGGSCKVDLWVCKFFCLVGSKPDFYIRFITRWCGGMQGWAACSHSR